MIELTEKLYNKFSATVLISDHESISMKKDDIERLIGVRIARRLATHILESGTKFNIEQSSDKYGMGREYRLDLYILTKDEMARLLEAH